MHESALTLDVGFSGAWGTASLLEPLVWGLRLRVSGSGLSTSSGASACPASWEPGQLLVQPLQCRPRFRCVPQDETPPS